MRNPKPTDRDVTIYRLALAGVSLHNALLLLRHSRAIQRYSVALCNGEWPYPKPGTYPGVVREACSDCEATTAKATLRPVHKGAQAVICPLCSEAVKVRALWAEVLDMARRVGRGVDGELEVCRDGGAGLAIEDSHGYSYRIGG